MRTSLLPLVTLCMLTGCGGSTPTAPENGASNIVAIGPQVLRIVYQSPCAQLGQGVLPLVYTRVDVAIASNEWVAAAAGASAGDIQVHFHAASQSVIAGSMPIAGTIAGTAIHMPELFPGPAWNVRATFNGSAPLNGVAFVAGALGAATSGLDGVGSGSLTMSDLVGNTCSGTTFSWSIFPLL